MVTRRRRYPMPLAAAALLLVSSGCGDNGPGTCGSGETGIPPNCVPVAIPSPCVQTVVESGTEAAVARTLYYFDFSVPDSGRLDITMDWTNPPSPVGIYLVPVNTCTLAEFNARSCNFLVRSEPSTAKPRKISVANFSAGNYRWIIANFSDGAESISYQFVLSKGGCPAITGVAPSATSRENASALVVERAEHR
jgi:hypothetical protein